MRLVVLHHETLRGPRAVVGEVQVLGLRLLNPIRDRSDTDAAGKGAPVGTVTELDRGSRQTGESPGVVYPIALETLVAAPVRRGLGLGHDGWWCLIGEHASPVHAATASAGTSAV